MAARFLFENTDLKLLFITDHVGSSLEPSILTNSIPPQQSLFIDVIGVYFSGYINFIPTVIDFTAPPYLLLLGGY